MARETKKQRRRRRILRLMMLGGLTTSLVFIAAMAWSWQQSVPMKRVVVSGAVHADSSEVVRYAALESDSVGLFDIEPDVVVDRVRRTPWVRDAVIRRRPTGTVSIRVEEREPVVLVIGRDGRPAYYLDGEGYGMPLVPRALYDVPLLRGEVPPYRPAQVINRASVVELLQALDQTDLETDALISEIELDASDDVVLHTSPAEGRNSIPVRLGKSDYSEKLGRLNAFWHQAVLSRPELTIRSIDLRFDGQIITREDSTLTSN